MLGLRVWLASAVLCGSLVGSGCKVVDASDSTVDDMTVLGGSTAHLYVQIEAASGRQVAAFFYDDGKVRRRYEPMHDAPIEARPDSDGHLLSYLGVDVGFTRGDRPFLCDTYDRGGVSVTFACNATFFNPGSLPSPAPKDGSADDLYVFDVSLAAPARASFALAGESVTLEAYAQNQINQYGTATCAYNAATGILEILHAMRTGAAVDFSEPFYLARSPAFGGTEWFWSMYQRVAAETGGMLPDANLPVAEIYRSGVGFDTAQSRAEERYKRAGGTLVPVSASLVADKLFFKAQWSQGYMRGNGQATEADYRSVVEWFTTNKSPVNVHYWIGGIWHSVVMIGYDAGSDSVLIKDSLGNTHLKGSWKSKQWFLRYVYAAIGVRDGGAVVPPVDDGDAVLPPPSGDDAVTPTLDELRSRLGVELVNGGVSGRYHVFTLRITGPATDLDRIVDVRYDVHPTFGASATRTVTDRANGFELGRYLTYARGWRTKGTVIRVRLGTEVHDLKLPGTQINW